MNEQVALGNKPIVRAAVNSSQVVVALGGGTIVYLELDMTGRLMEMGTIDIGYEICSVDIGLPPEGRLKSSFVAVGCYNDTVQILSLSSADLLNHKTSMSVSARPDSVCLVQMMQDRGTAVAAGSTADALPTLYLNVGLSNGVLVRVAVDPVVGSLSDSRQRFLGTKSIKLSRVVIRGQQALIAFTSRSWLMYNYQGRYFQAPMSYESLEYASSFSSEVCSEGIVAVAGNTLRIITVDNLGETFNQTVYPLRYTPKKLVRLPNTSDLVVIETDHHEYNEAEKSAIAAQLQQTHPEIVTKKEEKMETNDEPEEEEGTYLPCRGPLPPADGKWASCIRIMDASTGQTKGILELVDNEAAFSVCICHFTQVSDESFVVVGTAKNLSLQPKRYNACFLHVYRILDGGMLQHLHETEIEDVPLAMCEFQGKLLVGVGKCLRLYELGKRKLLRKAENKLLPSCIVRIQVMGDRIYVGDLTESVHFMKYRRDENLLVIFADDTLPR